MELKRISDEEIVKVSNKLDTEIGFQADYASQNRKVIAQAQLEADRLVILKLKTEMEKGLGIPQTTKPFEFWVVIFSEWWQELWNKYLE